MDRNKLLKKILDTLTDVTQQLSTNRLESRTLSRLKDSCFFLLEMEKNYMKSQDFFYHLSAYILHSRTVLWVMRKEYCEIQGWKEWYDSIDATQEEKELLKKLTKLRNDIEKKGRDAARIKVEFTVSQESIKKCLRNSGFSKMEELTEWFEKNKGAEVNLCTADEAEVQGGIRIILDKLDSECIELKEFPDRDIMEVCTRYFYFLHKIVFECIKKFSINKRT